MLDYELKQLQSLPLEAKIHRSLRKIREWVEYHNGDVYVSFSGGKDSTAVLYLVRMLYPDVVAVFDDTALEYPEVREFVKSTPNVHVIRPKIDYKTVIDFYGYPVVSKEQSQYIYEYLNTESPKLRDKRMNGVETAGSKGRKYGKISAKWHFLLDAPFLISNKCCEIMKKRPFLLYEKESGNAMITGEMAVDSQVRSQKYLENGCNAFDLKRPKSTPIGFWTEQDVLQFLEEYEIPYSSVYGEIAMNSKGARYTTKSQRTGCIFCMFGVHLERGMNRFQRLQSTHPELWKHCIYKLNLKQVLEYMKIPYKRSTISKAKYKTDTIKISCRVNKEKLDALKLSYGNLSTTELVDLLINEKVSDTFR